MKDQTKKNTGRLHSIFFCCTYAATVRVATQMHDVSGEKKAGSLHSFPSSIAPSPLLAWWSFLPPLQLLPLFLTLHSYHLPLLLCFFLYTCASRFSFVLLFVLLRVFILLLILEREVQGERGRKRGAGERKWEVVPRGFFFPLQE